MKYHSKSGSASICHWCLAIRLKNKDQCAKFIQLLMDEPIDYDFKFNHGYEDNEEIYEIHIKNGIWASNLSQIAKLLEKVDYEFED